MYGEILQVKFNIGIGSEIYKRRGKYLGRP